MLRRPWVRVVVPWSVVSAIWIVVTDRLVARFGLLPEWGQPLKGWFFVAITAIFVAILMDRATRREAALRDRLLEAQKHEALARLAREVAHDFNNLLTAIIGFTSLARERMEEDDPGRERLAQVLSAAERSGILTRQLLDFGRRASVGADGTSTDLQFVVEELDVLLQSLLGSSIALSCRHEEDADCRVPVARPRLEQVLLNLVVNARDAMAGGGELRLRTGVRSIRAEGRPKRLELPPGDYVLLLVEDTGSGIDPRALPRIFEPFFTTREGGTGLGLATCRSIVEQHGGAIRVESWPGKGTRFEVFLPCASAMEPLPLEVRQSRETLHGSLIGGPTILLAEDDPHLRQVASVTLRQAGARVMEAADGLEAVARIRATPGLDLLVTDLAMPKLGGALVAQRLAEYQPRVPVLFISALPTEPSELHGHFLAKPFTPTQLVDRVRDALDGAGAAASPAAAPPSASS